MIAAIDRLIEVQLQAHKAHVLRPLERKLNHQLAAAWRKQGRRFLLKLEGIRDRFPAESVEAVRRLREAVDDEWPDLWDETAAESAAHFGDALQPATEQSLLTGATSLINSFGLDMTFSLDNPRAVEYMSQHGAALVTQLNQTTRDRLNALLTDSLDQGLSYNKISGLITQLFDGFGSFRAEVVSVTELAGAYEAGSSSVVKDLQDQGLQYEKSWLAEGEACDICAGNVDDGWISTDEGFSSGDDLPPAHPVCRCLPGETRIESVGLVAAYRRWFEGELIEVRTARGHQLTATPNHPVLTDRGWVSIECLQEGDHLISRSFGEALSPLNRGPDVEGGPAKLSQVFDAMALTGDRYRIAGIGVDFHGDGRDGDVEVVVANGQLERWVVPSDLQPVAEFRLAAADQVQRLLGRDRMSPVCSHGESLPLSSVEPSHPNPHRGGGISAGNASSLQGPLDRRTGYLQRAGKGQLGLAREVPIDEIDGRTPPIDGSLLGEAAARDVVAVQPPPDRRRRNAEAAPQANNTLASQISPDEVLGIRRFPWSGNVYNLQTETGWYTAEGIVTQNCTTLYQRVGSSEES